MTNFQDAMTFVAKWEWSNDPNGAYHNDPADPGGETKYGIDKASHPDLDIASLTIADAFTIYQREYWDANSLDNRTFPYNVALMDSYVQHNPKKVSSWDVQANGDRKALIQLRRLYYLAIIRNNPSEVKFKNGWMNRINDLSKYCDILAQPV